MEEIPSSGIGEVLSLAESKKGVIKFVGGLPHPTSFPIETIADLTNQTIREYGSKMLQYSDAMGLEQLRALLAKRFNKKFAKDLNHENVLITTGSLQAIYLLSKAFIREGDPLVVEAPTYSLALTTFRIFQPTFITIPMDNQGMNIEQLISKLEQGLHPKFVYTIPTFQNPTGITMSKRRRKKLVELASQYDFFIIEDAPYNSLRYQGDSLDPLFSLDAERRTLFISTFSKTFAPGMRLGWIIGKQEWLKQLAKLKHAIDACTSAFCQYITHQYLKTGKLDAHLPKLRKMYATKQAEMLDALKDYMPKQVEWTEPNGGMFLWVKVPEGIDTQKMLEEAIDHKVAYMPGSAFFIKNPQANTMRLNYTFVDNGEIREGIQRLSEVITQQV